MALKTFNLDDEVYSKYSEHCKKEGISMSKRVNAFIERELTRIEAKIKPQQLKRTEPIVHPASRYS